MPVEAVQKAPMDDGAPPASTPPARLKQITIKLTTPVQAHGDMLKEITFRRPTGGDIMAMGDGYPIIIDWETGNVRPNPVVMGKMMSVLAAVPPSTIKAMDAEDWSTCAHALMGFFPPGVQAMARS
jgi:Phage tail assembly chaperone proteins, E, or 41 or 14